MTSSVGARITAALRKRPLLWNGITGGLLCAASDGATQRYEAQWKTNTTVRDKTEQSRRHDTKGDDDRNGNSKESSKDGILAPSPIHNIKMLLPVRKTLEDDCGEGEIGLTHDALDWRRLIAAGCIGVFFGGCVYPFAYAKLDAVWTGTALATVIKKSIVEIATVGIFVNSCSMTSRGLLRGDKDVSTVAQHVVQEIPTVTRDDFFVWFPYNMLAFSVIPSFVRPISTLFMEASWQAYISFRSHDFEDTLEQVHSCVDGMDQPQPV